MKADSIRPRPQTIVWKLSLPLILLMFIQSASGLVFPELYRDNLFVRSAWYGNDAVTLFVGIPVLIASMILAGRASLRAYLVWLGMLAYSFYNFSFYLFGSVLNVSFLLFVALFTLSGYGLIFGFLSIPWDRLLPVTWNRVPARGISSYMFVWGLFLAGLWIAQSLAFTFQGQVPQIVLATAHPTNVTAALDLSMMVPAVLLGAFLLWKRSSWGYVLAVVMNVKGALYALVLAAGSFFAARSGIEGVASQIPLWLGLCFASVVCCVLLLKGYQESTRSNHSSQDFP